jgi:DNA-binding transcriptional MerR regulator
VSRSRNELSIGEVARATGLSEATLRAWERRFGFPSPARGEGGQRRYAEPEIEQIERVLELRQRGVGLRTAIDRLQATGQGERSFFAALRARQPELAPIATRKRDLLRLCRAVEDESAARAERGLLFGAFQEERFYRQSERRWTELGRIAAHTFAFAQFHRTPRRRAKRPTLIPLAAEAPATREWALVCLAPEHAALLVAWEPPGRTAESDGEREFELLFSLRPVAVREAARAALAIAAPRAPEEAAAAEAALETMVDPVASAQLDLSAAITARTLASLSPTAPEQRR